MSRSVDFYFGAGSRYSYLASTQVSAMSERLGCRFRWLPLNSRALICRDARDPFVPVDGKGVKAPPSGQYDWDYRKRDALMWARHYRVPYNEPVDRLTFDHRLTAHACLAGERQGAVEAMSRRVMALIFIDERTAIDITDLTEAAAAEGLDVDRFRRDLEGNEVEEMNEARVSEAASLGAFGVPSFHFDGRLFWGNDRLVLLEAALEGSF
ncbi:MAG: DsbA family protein [Alphaproteobacteria bacterium]|nr:DsbA family protein [Alphaproteobacteria bacterium]